LLLEYIDYGFLEQSAEAIGKIMKSFLN